MRGTTWATITLMAIICAGCEMFQQKAAVPAPDRKIDPPPARTAVVIDPILKESARQQLVQAMSHPDETVRAHAIEAIKDSLGAEGQKEILLAFHDPQPLVRFAAAMAAGELRLAAAQPFLAPLAGDPDPHVQIGAIFALHRLGDTRYSSGLERALQSPVKEVRANAAFALGRLGEPTAVRILKSAMRDSTVEVRLQVAEALWRLGDREGLKYLVAASVSRHPAHQMVGLLGLAGPGDPSIIEHVRAGLGSEYDEVALVAARALGTLGSEEAYTLASKATQSAEWRQRYLAALALGAIARPDAAPTLAPLLKDTEADVRLAAAGAILELK